MFCALDKYSLYYHLLYIVLYYVTPPHMTKLLPFTLCIPGQSCRLWCKLQDWAFYNSKSSIPNGSASPFGEAGHIPRDENLKTVISRKVPQYRWAFCDRRVPWKCWIPWDCQTTQDHRISQSRQVLWDRWVPRDHQAHTSQLPNRYRIST